MNEDLLSLKELLERLGLRVYFVQEFSELRGGRRLPDDGGLADWFQLDPNEDGWVLGIEPMYGQVAPTFHWQSFDDVAGVIVAHYRDGVPWPR